MSSDLVAFLHVECKRMEFAGVFAAERHLGIYHGRNEGLWNRCRSRCGAPFPHHAGCWRDAGAATVLPNPGQGTGRTAQPMGPKCRSVLDFQTARSHMSQLVRVCHDAACTNTGICCSRPPNPAFPVWASLRDWPQGWGCRGLPRETICKHFNATCAPAQWESGFVLLGCVESSVKSASGSKCGACSLSFPALPLTLPFPKDPQHWCPRVLYRSHTRVPEQKPGCLLLSPVLLDKQE